MSYSNMDLSKLNEQQKLAVTTTEGPVLVIAGAGTGKTSVLTTRIAYIISQLSIDPNRILAFTFTNKAAEEMKVRINKMIPHANAQWIRTYHGTCLKILKEDIGRLGWDTNFSIIDEEDQISLVKSIIKDYKLESKVLAKKIVKCIGEIKLDDIVLANYSYYELARKFEVTTEQDARVIVRVYDIYNQRLKAANQLDFSDLINFTHKLFKEHEDIRKKWQLRFDYVLIDEFQDTNMKQFDIIKFIVGDHNNVFAVGDPNQTIYTWRGAYPEIFDDFYNCYKGTKVIKLAHNYRSAPNILKAANELISNNPTNFKNDLIPMVPTNAEVKVFIGGWQEDEANFVCSVIKDYVKKYGRRYDDILVLYRANYCSRLIEEKLILNQIPYVIFGSVNFYARKEIKDLISYLKMLYRPDDISAMRIINVPRRAIGIDTVDKISSWATNHNMSLVQALNEIESIEEVPNAAKTKIRNFLLELSNLKAKVEEKGWDRAIDVIVKEIKYIEWLQSSESEIEDRQENIEALSRALSTFKIEHPNSTPIDFINDINLYTAAEKTKLSDTPSVHLMTVHMAKGKEYDTVFLYNFNEGVIPSPNSLIMPGGLEEERRIAYVAMTRAKENLFITCTQDKFHSYNRWRASAPSRFLKELYSYKDVYHSFKSTSNSDVEWYDSKKHSSYYDQEVIDDSKIYTNTYQYKVGDIVVHTTFGSGVVVKVDGTMIDVIFKAPHGKKTLVASHKALKRVVS